MYSHPLTRRNMCAGVIHGAFFQMATAFVEPFALLPIFLRDLTSSSIQIGLAVSLLQSGRALPQLWASRMLRGHPNCGRTLMLSGVWMRWVIWGVLTVLVAGPFDHASWHLGAILALLTLYSVAGGVANIAINQVIADTIPPGQRSSFFGLRLLFGGALAVAAGWLVKHVLAAGTIAKPANYDPLFMAALLALGVAYTSLSVIRFPVYAAKTPANFITPAWKEIRTVLHRYPVLWRLAGVQVLAGGLAIVLPFITLHGTGVLGFSYEWVGIVIMSHVAGAALGDLLWMPMGNRKGTRCVAISGIAAAVLGLALLTFFETATAFVVGFAILGFAGTGISIGFDGYILELGPGDLRPLLVGIQESLLLPVYFMPLAGGVIAGIFGFRILAMVAMIMLAMAWWLGWKLHEPRHHRRERIQPVFPEAHAGGHGVV